MNSENRDQWVKLRATAAEKAAMYAGAAAVDLDFSEWARQVLLDAAEETTGVHVGVKPRTLAGAVAHRRDLDQLALAEEHRLPPPSFE